MRRLDPTLLLTLSTLLLTIVLPGLARAQGAWVSIEADVISPEEKATLIVVPDANIWRAEILLTRDDGKTQSFQAGRTQAQTGLTFAWKQEEGEHAYDVEVVLVDPEGRKSTVTDSFSVVVAGPLSAEIPADRVDLEARTFEIISNRTLSAVQIEILDEQLQTVVTETIHVESVKGKPTSVTWPEPDSDQPILRIWVRAFDHHDFWADNEIIPWSLTIAHEDVNFETNKYDVLPDEAPKLDKAYKEIRKAVKKYGEWVQCKLYIAGYTDTVGAPGSNQTLSLNRAKSIARYFQEAGFEFPIYYQGFGESVLAVPTDDSVDELANRRAVYVIAADTPPRSKDLPRASWTRLQ